MTTYTTARIASLTAKAGKSQGELFNMIATYLVKHQDDVNALPALYAAMGPDQTDSNKGKLVRSLWTMRGTDWTDMGGRTTFGWVGNVGPKPPLTVKAIVKLAKAGTTSRDMVEALKRESADPIVRDKFSNLKTAVADLPTKANGQVHANRRADVQAMIDTLTAMLPAAE